MSGSPSAEDLGLVLERYPYFQAPRYLLLRLLKEGDDHRFQEEVRKAAVQCTHRGHLYSFLHPAETPKAAPAADDGPAEEVLTEEQTVSETAEALLELEEAPVEANVLVPEPEQLPDEPAIVPVQAEDSPIARLKRNLLLDIAQVEAPNDLLSQILSYPEVAREQDAVAPISVPLDVAEAKEGSDRKSFSAWLKSVPAMAAHSELPSREPQAPFKEKSTAMPAVGVKPQVDRDDLVSETLAQVYAKQGDTARAIRIYEKLSLIYPEKSAYFAALVEKLVKNP